MVRGVYVVRRGVVCIPPGIHTVMKVVRLLDVEGINPSESLLVLFLPLV